jgi:hypothetical protein
MKKTVFSAILLIVAIATAKPMNCRQYQARDEGTPLALAPSENMVAGTIDIDGENLKIVLSTTDSALLSMNNVTLKYDSWLSASYWEAYSNLDDENLLYGVYFEKDWRDSADPVVGVLINIDDMKNLKSTRMVMVCSVP